MSATSQTIEHPTSSTVEDQEITCSICREFYGLEQLPPGIATICDDCADTPADDHPAPKPESAAEAVMSSRAIA